MYFAMMNQKQYIIYHFISKKYCNQFSKEIDIYTFSSGEDLLNSYRPDFDIIFLDIKMHKLDGIEVAYRIRLIDSNVQIFFLTSIKRYSLIGYEVDAVNYLIKPLSYDKFVAEMTKAITRLKTRNEFILVKNSSGYYKIYYSDIIFIESDGRTTLIHQNGKKIPSPSNMKQMEESLDSSCFFRCHTSYIVNLKHVHSVSTTEIILYDDIKIPLSRKKRKEFTDKWLEYLG